MSQSFAKKGQRATERLVPFHSSYISWVKYFPLRTSPYFGQQMVFNICIYKNRYRHQYLAMMDVDEFLAPHNQTLLQALHLSLPPDTASLQLPLQWLPVDCPEQHGKRMYVGYDLFNYTGPDLQHFAELDKDADIFSGSKSIVRPMHVILYHVHSVMEVAAGKQPSVRSTPAMLAFKHVRCGF